MTPPTFVYLASQSPRRAQLLAQIGVRHELLLAPPDEDTEALEAVHPGEAPLAYVQRVTQLKFAAALQRWQQQGLIGAPILCADTTVALGEQILGKPADAMDAQRMLQRLSGHTHQVLTAVVVGTAQGVAQAVSVSQVRFAALTADDIAAYVASGEPMGKAGAYAVQGLAAVFIEQIEGSFSGIMGLPLRETVLLFRSYGLGWPTQPIK
jgi:septum formation protein